MNKKAHATPLYWSLAIFFIIALVVYMSNRVSTDNLNAKTPYPGKIAINILQLENEAKLIQSYIKSAAIIESKNIIQQMAKTGGNQDKIPCYGAVHDKASIWSFGKNTCFPNYKASFKILLQTKLDKHIEKLDTAISDLSDNTITFPKTYETFVHEDTIVGTSVNSLTLDHKDHYYIFQPDFKLHLPYNFSEYDELKSKATILINECNGNQDLSTCIIDKTGDFNLPANRILEWDFESFITKPQSPSQPLYFYNLFSYCFSLKDTNCTCELFEQEDDLPELDYILIEPKAQTKITTSYYKGAGNFAKKEYSISLPFIVENTTFISEAKLELNDDEIPMLSVDTGNSKKQIKLKAPIQIYKTKNNFSIITPDPKNPIRKCNIETNQYIPVHFKVKSRKKLPVFDFKTEKMQEQEIIYNFVLAFTPPTQNPPPTS